MLARTDSKCLSQPRSRCHQVVGALSVVCLLWAFSVRIVLRFRQLWGGGIASPTWLLEASNGAHYLAWHALFVEVLHVLYVPL